MSNLGHLFKEKRELQLYSVADVSADLKINKDIIGLLEEGLFYELPSYVYAYGFVRKYADFLKLDPEEIKLLFDVECVKEKFGSFYDDVLPLVEHKPASSNIPGKKIVIAMVVVLLLIAGIVYIQYVSSKSKTVAEDNRKAELLLNNNQKVVEDNSSDVNKDNISSLNIDKETEIEKLPVKEKVDIKAKSTVSVKKNKDVSVIDVARTMKREEGLKIANNNASILFTDTCWVHVNIDNLTHLDFIADAGMKKNIKFNDYFIMDIGNASVVAIVHNKKTISGLGGFRQPVKHLKFYLNDSETLIYSKIK